MRVAALSDLHGYLPDAKYFKGADIILLAGDILPADCYDPRAGAVWLHTILRSWLESFSVPVIAVAGNHDFVFETKMYPRDLPWTYLQDSGCIIRSGEDALLIDIHNKNKINPGDKRIWGSPWQLPFYDWAFNAAEEELAAHWKEVPRDTDILLLHGPPYGKGDLTKRGVHVGSSSLNEKIKEIQPQLVVWGHIHEAHGRYDENNIIMANVSTADDNHAIHFFDLQT